ncbi:hypothetical protein [Tuberibacillus calidus]|jgi:hypothetical protein|uniref:hypothetical protein n=1 Tax=Tuberibacillus calidus TaxID=340097 RepID=UPI000403F271|nr:hypothetical protein [Tuberibacillus calidus]
MNESSSLPPRRKKHGGKKREGAVFNEDTGKSDLPSPREIQQLNSRLARRKALQAFALNPQGYKEQKKQASVPVNRQKEKPRKRWSAGLIAANVILSLFLLFIGLFFIYIIYYYQ